MRAEGKALREELRQYRRTLDVLRSTRATSDPAVQDLEREVQRLEQALESLENAPPAAGRATDPSIAPPAAGRHSRLLALLREAHSLEQTPDTAGSGSGGSQLRSLAEQPVPASDVLINSTAGSALLARIAMRRKAMPPPEAPATLTAAVETRLFGSLVSSGRASLQQVSSGDFLGETSLPPGDTVIHTDHGSWEVSRRQADGSRQYILALNLAAQRRASLHVFPVREYLAAQAYRPDWLPQTLSISPDPS